MQDPELDFWTDQTSVLFTSFWGWTPESWGTIGWTGKQGLTRRTNLLKKLSNPFIAVIYVTSNKDYIDPGLKGKIAGFYLMSHETGDRDEFTGPQHHGRDLDKWRHSLRAIRAFSYIPERRISVSQLNPVYLKHARNIASMGKILTRPSEIALLRETPWIEVEVYSSGSPMTDEDEFVPTHGMVKAGPANKLGYVVSKAAVNLKRQLYVLRLTGNTDAYIGEDANGHSIFKIGLSKSPELRRQSLQKLMPRGIFRWKVERATADYGEATQVSFNLAVRGEYAMKQYLKESAKWLGGEFYLASESVIEKAWRLGQAALKSSERRQ